jgi:hypothetical protein
MADEDGYGTEEEGKEGGEGSEEESTKAEVQRAEEESEGEGTDEHDPSYRAGSRSSGSGDETRTRTRAQTLAAIVDSSFPLPKSAVGKGKGNAKGKQTSSPLATSIRLSSRYEEAAFEEAEAAGATASRCLQLECPFVITDRASALALTASTTGTEDEGGVLSLFEIPAACSLDGEVPVPIPLLSPW